MTIVLLGNYPPDKQESMLRFADMLQGVFQQKGIKTAIWQPKPILGAFFSNQTTGLGKWAGYIDKWLLFPWVLLAKQWTVPNAHFHICDHSNAPYLAYLPKKRTTITCHDVLAIRGALGDESVYCPASGFGKWLQKYISYFLFRAERIACDSQATLHDLYRLTGHTAGSKPGWKYIHLSFNAPFHPEPRRFGLDWEPETETQQLLQTVSLDNKRYLLHVGGGHARKNRRMLVQMLALLQEQYPDLLVCFAGESVSAELQHEAAQLGVGSKVVSIVKPSFELLQALYNGCEAFIFPSYSEGFGWPPLEAQACGVPVIVSSTEPMPEIGGEGVLTASPFDPQAFADAFLSLSQGNTREEYIQAGFQNITRFRSDVMIERYIAFMEVDKEETA